MTLRILIVEDDGLIALDLAMTVEELGHVVAGEAAEADAAVEAAGRLMPDIVMMDLKLRRGSSGVDAAEAIHGRYGIRSLFISGNIDGDVRARVAAIDPVGWLHKPVSPTALRRILAEFAPACLKPAASVTAPPSPS